MANLCYPQLSSGAQVQYPVRKRQLFQSALNVFADGTMLTSNINRNSQLVWELAYTELTIVDRAALQNHFLACQGPLQPFTFIDPTGNMLSNSTDLTLVSWERSPLLSVVAGALDPFGGTSAFTVTNSSQTVQQLSQQMTAPANFQYCLSLYACASAPSSLILGWNSESSQSQRFAVASRWTRFVNSSRISDNLMSFTVSLSVPPAQTLVVWGPQLEPQLAPSGYRPTVSSGGVYHNAHLLGDSITFQSDAPGLFSTLIRIETT